MKQFSLFVVSTTVLIAALINSAHAMQLTLAPQASQLIENHYGFALNATCTIKANNKKNKIKLRVLQNTGTINGRHLSQGQSTSVTLQSNDAVSVHAEPGSKVNVENLSDNIIEASCSV